MAITPPQTGSSHVGFEDDLELPPDRLERHSSVSTGLKNYSKWRMVPNSGKRISRFVPMKLPYDAAHEKDAHNIPLMKSRFPDLDLVLDLQMQDNVYSCQNTGVEHRLVRHESKKIPSPETVKRFIEAARAWWDIPGHERSVIAVHCHYGFNRTGFLIVSYLVLEEGWSVDRAINGFNECRPPGIKHVYFMDELRRRYGDRSQPQNQRELEKDQLHAEQKKDAAMKQAAAIKLNTWGRCINMSVAALCAGRFVLGGGVVAVMFARSPKAKPLQTSKVALRPLVVMCGWVCLFLAAMKTNDQKKKRGGAHFRL
mmetsp:Transcript_25364/g.46221  ORF Transcript_25364/g.46221 Transcript_25364/m.46221 type:complete len:312 (+) Transcript_25364:107-1042(+)